MNTMIKEPYLYGYHRITGCWKALQGPADVETLEQYRPYFSKETLSDHYSHVPFSGFSGDIRPVYSETHIGLKPPRTKAPKKT